MAKLIVNADDFGLSRGVNYGIVDAYLNGILTSTTLMVTMPGLMHAIELSKQHPGLKVGLHLNIALGTPLTEGKSLTDSQGQFIKPNQLPSDHVYDEEEVYRELEAQYEKFVFMMKRKPTHLDSHLFTSDLIDVMNTCARRLANTYQIPLRNNDIPGFNHVRFLQFRTYHASMGLEYFYDHIDDIVTHEYSELMTHPAYMDSFIMSQSSYNLQRLEELDFLTSEKTLNLIKEYKIELISYEDVSI